MFSHLDETANRFQLWSVSFSEGRTRVVSPDGKLLAYPYTQYSRVLSDGWKVALMPANRGRLVKQFEIPGGIGGMRWSPTGAALQYVFTQEPLSHFHSPGTVTRNRTRKARSPSQNP